MNGLRNHRELIEFIKFNIVAFGVTLLQLILVNLLRFLLKDFTAPLPAFLTAVFNADTVGAQNVHWGYVLPFFLSNLIANIFGFFQNRKTTFHSDAPKSTVFVFLAVMFVLILVSTWVQGRVVFLINENLPSLRRLAPTIAALLAGVLQFCVIYPLEKFVLFRKKKEGNENA